MGIIGNLIIKLVKSFNNYKSFTKKYTFENRSKSSGTLCMILAGYKEFTWDIVFERIKKFSDNDEMDICIVSSGLYSEKLSKIAEINGWSYMSTKRNSVSLAQNMAIKLFPNAEYIYKLDEDIFVTKNFFKTLEYTYGQVQKYSNYDVGFVAPIIPINGYAHIQLLKRLNLMDDFEQNFGKVKHSAAMDKVIVNNPEAAKYMWGENDKIPHIDNLDKMLNDDDFIFSICPIRFSIGAIYYSRELWEDMNYFNVSMFSIGMGVDEVQICSHCMANSKAIVISENTCVGHLSFGPQNEVMTQYFKENPLRFIIHE